MIDWSTVFESAKPQKGATEAEVAAQWDTCADPKHLLDARDDPRKLRLFACACARRVWNQMPHQLFREAVELAERIADEGLALEAVREALKDRCEALEGGKAHRNTAASSATRTLTTAAANAAWNAAFAAALAEAGSHGGPAWDAARAKQANLLREIFGNPLRPVHVDPAWRAWNARTVPQIANRIYATNAFADLPVLADAIEDAGCTNTELLAHLRDAREHLRGCWALDLLRDEPP